MALVVYVALVLGNPVSTLDTFDFEMEEVRLLLLYLYKAIPEWLINQTGVMTGDAFLAGSL